MTKGCLAVRRAGVPKSPATGSTGPVSYDILAFFRPLYPLARLGYPSVCRLQKRFARVSAVALMREVRGREFVVARDVGEKLSADRRWVPWRATEKSGSA